MTKNTILENLQRPEALEEEFQHSPQAFETQLKEALEKNKNSETLKVWHARLSYSPPVATNKISLGWLVFICFTTCFFVKMPTLLPIDGAWFYQRFVPIIVVASVIAYFIKTTKYKGNVSKIVMFAAAASAVYLGILPTYENSASITMALVHLPLFFLSLAAASFMGDNWNSVHERLNFIRYLGEMGIYSILILLGGMVLSGITMGLFSLIGLSIEQWYMEYIVVLGLVSTPLVATYLYDSILNRQGKFATVLSNVFSPLFLITVIAYILATVYQGKSPFTDRDFLITFNGLLLIILAITIFSISGKKRTVETGVTDVINVLLVGTTLLVNVIALSAILFRWSEYGMSVNRVVVTGANILIFFHLTLILKEYIGHIMRGNALSRLEAAVTKYLPLYTVWSLIVAIFLPLMFSFQ